MSCKISVCQNASCNSVGSSILVRDIEELARSQCEVEECSCLGKCGMGPNVEITGKSGIPIIHTGIKTFEKALEFVRKEAKVTISDLAAKIAEIKYEARRDNDLVARRSKIDQCIEMIGGASMPELMAELLVMRSVTALSSGKEVESALKDAKAAVELSPSWGQALLALAGACEASNLPIEALKACKDAQKLGKCLSKTHLTRRMKRLQAKADGKDVGSELLDQKVQKKVLSTNIFRPFGGRAKFDKLAHDVHELMFKHPLIKDFFPPTMDNSRITRRNADFLVGAFGGPKYIGPDMISTHEFLRITDQQYDAMVACFGQVLDEWKVNDDHREVIMMQLEGMRYTIVYRPDRPKPLARKMARYHELHESEKRKRHEKRHEKKAEAVKPTKSDDPPAKIVKSTPSAKTAQKKKKPATPDGQTPAVVGEKKKLPAPRKATSEIVWSDWTVGGVVPMNRCFLLLHLRNKKVPVEHPFECEDVWHTYVLKDGQGQRDDITRSYTPVSTAEDYKNGILDLFVKVYPDGQMTQWLATLKDGDVVPVSSPLKAVSPENYSEGLFMIAGGSAVTVAAQLCKAVLKRCAEATPVRVVLCYRTKEDALFAEIFAEMQAEHPPFQVYYFIEEGIPDSLPNENAVWKAGRITAEALEDLDPRVRGVVSGPVGLSRAALNLWTKAGRGEDEIKFLDGVGDEQPDWLDWTVAAECSKFNHDCIRLVVKCADEVALSKHPFMCRDTWHVDFMVEDGEGEIMRSYTPITNSSDYRKGFMEFLIKLYPDGKMSKWFAKCSKGDTLSISAPSSTVDPINYLSSGLCMIAGGSAVTVAIQLCKAVLRRRPIGTKVHLVMCNRTYADVLLGDVLEEMQANHSDFHVVHCISEGLPEPLPDHIFSGHAIWKSQRLTKDVLYAVSPHAKGVVSGPPGLCRAALDSWIASGHSEWTMNCLDKLGEPLQEPDPIVEPPTVPGHPRGQPLALPQGHPPVLAKRSATSGAVPFACPFGFLLLCGTGCTAASKDSDVDGATVANQVT